jgi:proline iminopeptidase
LFVREIGNGPPVVVLHGGPGAQHDYLFPAFGRLADEFHLRFYDQRGGGRSQVTDPHKIGWRDHVADLEALRKEWRLDRLPLLGYSWGGLLALLYAAEHPANVRALVLVAPAAGWGDHHRRFKEELDRRGRSAAVQRMQAELEASGLKQSDPQLYQQRRFDLNVAGYYMDPENALGSETFVVQLQAQQATWASLKGHGPELKSRLQRLQVPTLILHGRHDPIPLEWPEELASVLPEARLVVLEHSAHVPYVEEAEETFGEIRRFLWEHAEK